MTAPSTPLGPRTEWRIEDSAAEVETTPELARTRGGSGAGVRAAGHKPGEGSE